MSKETVNKRIKEYLEIANKHITEEEAWQIISRLNWKSFGESYNTDRTSIPQKLCDFLASHYTREKVLLLEKFVQSKTISFVATMMENEDRIGMTIPEAAMNQVAGHYIGLGKAAYYSCLENIEEAFKAAKYFKYSSGFMKIFELEPSPGIVLC